MTDSAEPKGRARGGFARAQILPPEKRSEIAQQAAQVRWSGTGRYATHEGELPLGDLNLPVAVLEDGTRVLTSASFLRALGRPWKGTYKRDELPNFIAAPNLLPFISDELLKVLEPIEYRSLRGQKVLGYRAELLPLVCDAYLAARTAGDLAKGQERVAAQAEVVVRSLSKIGIIALVDEATGYQEVRARNELRMLLEAYVSAEFLPWTKRFPDEFYKELFRLRGWNYDPLSVKRPILVGKLTENIVYKRLPPGVLEELKRLNPKDEKGRRRKKHFQFLSGDIGNPHLEKHLVSAVTLMKISPNYKKFKEHLDNVHPIPQSQMNLPFGNVEDDEDA